MNGHSFRRSIIEREWQVKGKTSRGRTSAAFVGNYGAAPAVASTSYGAARRRGDSKSQRRAKARGQRSEVGGQQKPRRRHKAPFDRAPFDELRVCDRAGERTKARKKKNFLDIFFFLVFSSLGAFVMRFFGHDYHWFLLAPC